MCGRDAPGRHCNYIDWRGNYVARDPYPATWRRRPSIERGTGRRCLYAPWDLRAPRRGQQRSWEHQAICLPARSSRTRILDCRCARRRPLRHRMCGHRRVDPDNRVRHPTRRKTLVPRCAADTCHHPYCIWNRGAHSWALRRWYRDSYPRLCPYTTQHCGTGDQNSDDRNYATHGGRGSSSLLHRLDFAGYRFHQIEHPIRERTLARRSGGIPYRNFQPVEQVPATYIGVDHWNRILSVRPRGPTVRGVIPAGRKHTVGHRNHCLRPRSTPGWHQATLGSKSTERLVGAPAPMAGLPSRRDRGRENVS